MPADENLGWGEQGRGKVNKLYLKNHSNRMSFWHLSIIQYSLQELAEMIGHWPSYLEVGKEHPNVYAHTHIWICSYRTYLHRYCIYGCPVFTPGKKIRMCNNNGQRWHSNPSWFGSGTLSACQVSRGRWTVVTKPHLSASTEHLILTSKKSHFWEGRCAVQPSKQTQRAKH